MKKMVSFFGAHGELQDALNRRAEEYAASRDIEYVWVPQRPYDTEAVIREMNDADACLVDTEPYSEPIFSRLNGRLRLLVRFGVGYDKVDLPAASKYGICCARTAGANRTGVAEMALTLMLAARRQLRINRKTVESGVWNKSVGNEILGGKVGILGFGATGQSLARLLRGFDCDILVYNRSRDEKLAAEMGVRYADLDEIFSTCDAVSIHLPSTPETHHLVSAERIGQMKKDAVIVNTARGDILDEDALYEALVSGAIGGAGLDVYSAEPFPADSKLIGLDNVILTPHVASSTVESLWNTYKKAIDIMADFFAGRELGRADLLNPDYAENRK